MERYSIIEEKFPREILLLKAKPCKWGKCSFCDYIDDNSEDIDEINRVNFKELAKVSGEFARLELINSASVFEFTEESLQEIKRIAFEKNIKELVFEAHWIYKDRLDEIREYFAPIDIFFKTGIETFDEDFRNKALKKGIVFDHVSEVSDKFQSACLMVAIEGQTKDMIRKDIEIGLENFERLTINVYNNNTSHIKRDDDLLSWFIDEMYDDLEKNDRVEILIENTDFGVG